MPSIVISYRRTDTDVMAGRIRDRLADHYGDAAVFIDIDNIPFGKDFRAHISDAVARSDVLLVVVGRRWLGAGKGRQPRIAEEADFVRLEVETAMGSGIPVIPVLIGTASMPAPGQLPESLREFAFINAAPVDTGRDFHVHMERLIRSLDQLLPDLENKKAAAELSSAKAAERPRPMQRHMPPPSSHTLRRLCPNLQPTNPLSSLRMRRSAFIMLNQSV
jgi:TIR domain